MGFEIGDNTFGYVYPQGNVFDIKKISNLLSKAGGKPKECELYDYSICGTGKAKPEFIITLKNLVKKMMFYFILMIYKNMKYN